MTRKQVETTGKRVETGRNDWKRIRNKWTTAHNQKRKVTNVQVKKRKTVQRIN